MSGAAEGGTVDSEVVAVVGLAGGGPGDTAGGCWEAEGVGMSGAAEGGSVDSEVVGVAGVTSPLRAGAVDVSSISASRKSAPTNASSCSQGRTLSTSVFS